MMLVAMGVVAAVRISACYSETLASDIAKILPLGLLTFMLLDSPFGRPLLDMPDLERFENGGTRCSTT